MDLDSFWNNEKLRIKNEKYYIVYYQCILSQNQKIPLKKKHVCISYIKKKSSCVCECNVPVFYRILLHVHAYTCRHYSLFTHFSFLRCVYLGRWRHITFHIHSWSLHLCHIEWIYLGYNFRTNNMSSLHCS